MSYVPIVIGIKPHLPYARPSDIQIIYKHKDKVMRLEYIHFKEAKKTIVAHGVIWTAYSWKYMDNLSDWEYL